jgi:hypothetical protein
MSTVLMIHRTVGEAVEAHLYGKPDDVKLETILDPAVLWSTAPKVYLTGLSALKTQKRLTALLAKIDSGATHRLERLAAEDALRAPGLTASARRQGRVMPKYGNGG